MSDDKKPKEKRALTLLEAAAYACVSKSTIKNWISHGLLPFEELPGRGTGSYCFRRIRKDDLDNFLNRYHWQQEEKQKKKLDNKLVLLPRKS